MALSITPEMLNSWKDLAFRSQHDVRVGEPNWPMIVLSFVEAFESTGALALDPVSHPPPVPDPVNHPPHYVSHPSGVECIVVTEHLNFCLGNAVKYLWRADLKNGVEDLRKALWYVQREIDRRERAEQRDVT